MKRYTLRSITSLNVKEDPEGEWVKCEDVEAETDRIRRSYEHRISVLQEERHSKQAQLIHPNKEIPVCNCAEMVLEMKTTPITPTPGLPCWPTWICLAHGYKRL